MRFLSFLALLVLGLHSSVHAQREYSQFSSGPFTYTWSNEWSVLTGDTLRVRRVLLNPTDTLLTAFRTPCESISTEVQSVSETKTCSPSKSALAPGDSIWAEIRGVVAAQAFTERGREWLSPPPAPFLRIPIVLRFTSQLGQFSLEEVDLQSVVRRAVHNENPDFMPVFMSSVAAQAVARDMPYLLLTLRISAEHDLDLRACWIGPDEAELGGSCQEPQPLDELQIALGSGADRPSPFVLGVEVYEEVSRVLALRFSVGGSEGPSQPKTRRELSLQENK